MIGYVEIEDCSIEIKTYNEQRVLTFGDIDRIYHLKGTTTRGTFVSNRDCLIEGADYIVLDETEAFERFKVKRKMGLKLFTENGFSFFTQTHPSTYSREITEKVIQKYFKPKKTGSQMLLDICEEIVGSILQSERGEQS